MRRAGKYAAASVIALSLVVGAGTAAMAADVKVKFGRTPDGPFRSELSTKLKKGDARNYYLQVKSITGDDEGTALRQGANPYYLSSSYFRPNGTEITGQMKNGDSYDFTVKGHKPKIIRLRARHQDGGPLGTCLEVLADDEHADTSQALLGFSVDPEECTL